jgi:hypothetical protein
MLNDTLRDWSLVFLNTVSNEVVANFSMKSTNSFANGGPWSMVIRLACSSFVLYGPRRRAYPLSAEPPKITCWQWRSSMCNLKFSVNPLSKGLLEKGSLTF